MNRQNLGTFDSAATLAAYERWAPSYQPVAHNPLMRAEEHAMRRHWPEVAGRRVLDLACGTGRYAQLLRVRGAAQVVALDFAAGMLRQVQGGSCVRASMMRLPFVAHAFNVVICGLASGHAPDFGIWANEIARVLQDGGTLLYSDFHPEAVRAGLKRAFADESGHKCTLPHRCYSVAAQERHIRTAGLALETIAEVRVGIELRETFAGSKAFYERWHGVPLVLVVRARK
jgi:malonyl-CoA O-methyltransferase